MQKDTAEIVRELGLCPDFKTFYDENKDYMVKESLSQLLEGLLNKTGLKKSQVIKAAELSEVYGYQIFSGIRIPERKKLLCLILAMKLNLEDAQILLKASGYSPLYVKIPFDSAVIYGICNHLSVLQMNNMLYQFSLPTLG